MAFASEGWKRSRLICGPGIPAPSGKFSVGCAYLMHNFEEETSTLLVRLFYPCQEGRYQYAGWYPHKRYTKGYFEFLKVKWPGLLSSVIRVVAEPKIPALYCAPLLTANQGEAALKGAPAETERSDGDYKPAANESEGKAEGVKIEDNSSSKINANSTASPRSHLNATTTSSGPVCTVNSTVFPVIVFSHGLGAMSMSYCGICCDLASHGYIVASVEHRDRSACMAHMKVPKPSGREGELQDDWLTFYYLRKEDEKFPVRNKQVKQRSMDARKALDLLGLLNDGAPVGNLLGLNFDFSQFKGRIDISTAAMIGHSFGGATTIQTLSEDQRFKCGICLDTWMLPIHKDLYDNGSVVQQPLIFINSSDFQWKKNIQQMTKMTKPSNTHGLSTSRIVTLIGSNHFYQADFLFIAPRWLSHNHLGSSDIFTGHRVNMDICHSFLKRHLLHDSAYQGPIPNLDGCEGHSEHILFGTNVDISDEPEEVGQEDRGTTQDRTNDEPSGSDQEAGQ